MRKRERQELIETLIRTQSLSTQQELAAELGKRGCSITQATISRDLRELGVQKGGSRDGAVLYVMPPQRTRRDPEAVLARLLNEYEAIIRPAQNLVVVKSDPGTAPTVGLAIDELDHPDIVGTVAGDDTVLLVLKDDAAAINMVNILAKLITQET